MPSNIEIDLNRVELTKTIEQVAEEPLTEVLGQLTDLNRTKKAAMDAHQYSLRG